MKNGFTLVEVLVVLAIMVIVSSVFLIGDHIKRIKIKNAALEWVALLNAAEQKALIDSAVIGVAVDAQGFEFFNSDSSAHWQPMFSTFKKRNWPTSAITFKTAQPTQPKIIIYPDGRLTPFVLNIGDHRIIGFINGEIAYDPKPTEHAPNLPKAQRST